MFLEARKDDFMGARTRITVLTALILVTFLLLVLPAYAISLTADEQLMLNLVNKERRANGLNALEIDSKMLMMARRYSQEMIDNNFFSHTSPVSGELLDRVTKAGVDDGWLLAGENLAGAPTVESAFQGLMNSPTHKDNILEPKYTHVGIGAIDGGPYGKMFSQEFIAYPNKGYTAASDPSLDILVYLNGNLLYSDPPSFISDGHTLVPAKEFLDELGIESSWVNDGKQLVIEQPNASITLTINNQTASVNGRYVALEAAPTT
ncbi:MAG: hypothetical protein HY779_05810, partial [Rubrobacteridae bacterium]|nr:hypothetical protein [Rubrobacteridae bacterium]